MSDTEHIRGTLVPIEPEETLELTAKMLCKESGYEKCTYHESYIECLEDEGYTLLL